MGRYAAKTNVPSSRSREEIERTLTRYGATAFGYLWDSALNAAVILFEMPTERGVRRVKFTLPMPDRNSGEFTRTETGRARSATAAQEAYDQATRQRWRALALVIKAKLEAVATGIVSLEEEFLSHIVLPDGSTVGEWAAPQLQVTNETGRMPALMPGTSKEN